MGHAYFGLFSRWTLQGQKVIGIWIILQFNYECLFYFAINNLNQNFKINGRYWSEKKDIICRKKPKVGLDPGLP